MARDSLRQDLRRLDAYLTFVLIPTLTVALPATVLLLKVDYLT